MPAPAAEPATASDESPVTTPLLTALLRVPGILSVAPVGHPPTMNVTGNGSPWTDDSLAALRREFGETFGGRTVLVTGADGFMGSHLTEALVHLDARLHACVRATSSGALHNIWHPRDRMNVHFADLTDRTSVDYLSR